MRMFLIALCAAVLAACAQTRGVVADRGAEAADAQLEATEWALCKSITVGAYVRRFDGYPEEREAYNKLCWPGSDTPAPPQ